MDIHKLWEFVMQWENNRAIKENNFECIVLRKEVEDVQNDEHFDISVSTPIKTWNLV